MTISDTKIKAIASAKVAAVEYCKSKGFSLDKLSEHYYIYFGDYVGVMHDMPYHGGGLTEDIDSRPKAVLTYDVKKGIIIPTDYAKQFLS